jgi:hypothetical protein
MKLRLAITAGLLACALGVAGAQEHPQQLLAEPWIKAAWNAALRGEKFQRSDRWIAPLDGVGSPPVTRRDASGREWLLAELCQPHNCSDNKLFLVVDRAEKRLWALQVTAFPTGRRYFGSPDPGIRKILDAAPRGDLSGISLTAATGAPPPAPAAATPSSERGTLTGELSYPSDYIPDDMKICAEEIRSKTLHCNARKIRSRRGTRYTLPVPPGDYHVFAQTAENPGQRAYYSHFVNCGMNVSCPSHERIAVTVAAGATVPRVNPQDWYAR